MRSVYPVVAAAALLLACSGSSTAPSDAGVNEVELSLRPVTVGLLQDCTPAGASYGDTVCDTGLRCAIVLVGDTNGALTQCVPTAAQPLAEGQACAYDQQSTSPTNPPKHFDRCAPGLICAPMASADLRCRRPCRLGTRGDCAMSELCTEPTQVSGLSYCAQPDACQPIAPQSGCASVDGGAAIGCYVVGDDKGTAQFCFAQQSYNPGNGAINAPCDHSWNCQPGLGCVTVSEDDEICRPYCPLPIVPDGGTPPDMGDLTCANDLGTCHAIAGYNGVGRCY